MTLSEPASGNYREPFYIATLASVPGAPTARGALWSYTADGILGQLQFDHGLDSRLLIHPGGVVEAASETIDRTQLYRDEENGGPSWLCGITGISGGVRQALVVTVNTGGVLIPEYLASLGFVEGSPEGVRMVLDGSTFKGML